VDPPAVASVSVRRYQLQREKSKESRHTNSGLQANGYQLNRHKRVPLEDTRRQFDMTHPRETEMLIVLREKSNRSQKQTPRHRIRRPIGEKQKAPPRRIWLPGKEGGGKLKVETRTVGTKQSEKASETQSF